VYGETKLAGEKALSENCSRHLIFRTSWVYAGKGNNFARTMLRLAKERSELSVINDQFGAPTGAELLADCTAHAIRVALNKPEVAGTYHLVASGTTTWYDYASLVFDEARKAGIELALTAASWRADQCVPYACKTSGKLAPQYVKVPAEFQPRTASVGRGG
jgi:dTDP-4-dehydrorhamnose reductase